MSRPWPAQCLGGAGAGRTAGRLLSRPRRQTGKNFVATNRPRTSRPTMTSEFIVAIPARYGASRLPGKPLRLIAGEPMVAHVARRALAAGATQVVIATDDIRIA